MSGRRESLISYLKSVTQSRRHFTDFLFKVILGVIILIVVSPFFLVLIQVASIGFWQVFGSGPGQGIEFFTTFPGVGLEGGIRNAFVGTVELIVLASAVGIPLSVFGAVYITLVCLLPNFMQMMANVPFNLGGTALLISVVVTMDFWSQVQSHLMSHQYDSLMKKSKLGNYGRSGI